MSSKPYMIGRYGSGILWCRRDSGDLIVLFNSTPIAKRSKIGAWGSVEKGWKITPLGSSAICVQLNDSDGVVVSLHGGS
jgi:hypothetical protein